MDNKKVATELVAVAKILIEANEFDVNQAQLNKIIDNFVRYLIGDKKAALRMLQQLQYKPDVSMSAGKEYNDLYDGLFVDLKKAVRRHLQTEVSEDAPVRIVKKPTPQIKKRLEELRKALQAENISYDELHELQTLAPYIDNSDVELLEAAGVPEDQVRG